MKLDCRQTPEEIGRDGANLFRRKSGQEQTLHDRRGRFEAARGHNRPFANNCFSVGYRHGQERIALVTMTFPKKGSRPIEVDAVPLRYVVSVSKVGEAGLFPINITVQLATGRGRLL
ncbi:MAG: hypothetical protein JF586_14370, partial [Burkholderiales bacterium]|nr:hypothetical protein [Burkholderiales bacterium]